MSCPCYILWLYLVNSGLFSAISFGLMTSHWIMCILMIELSMFCFIFMIYEYKHTGVGYIESIKYFIPQTWGSFMLLAGGLFMVLFEQDYLIAKIMYWSGLFLKLGVFPMHFWVLPVYSTLNFNLIGIMGTMMKILPLSLFISSYIHLSDKKSISFLLFMGFLSMVIGLLLGLQSRSMRTMLGASSITHGGWFLYASSSGDIIFYFLFYSMSLLMVTMILNYNMSVLGSWAILSLSGLPPFSVFTAKVIVLLHMLNNNVPLIFIIPALMVVVLSLFYYLKFAFYYYLMMKTPLQNASFWSFCLMLSASSIFILSMIYFFYGRVGISFLL